MAEDGLASLELEPRRSATRWVVVSVFAVVVALLVLLATRDTQRNNIGDGRIVGQPVPAVAGSTLDGGFIDIDDYRGRWVVVNFFATTCIPCIQEHPELVEFADRHPDGDVELISVVFNDDTARVREFFAERGGDWPVLVGDTGVIALDFGVVALPETYIVSPRGIVLQRLVGGITADALDALFGDVLVTDAAGS